MKNKQHPHTILQHITCLKFLGTVSFCWARKISQLEPYTNLSLHKLWGPVHKRLQSTPSIHALVKIKDIQIIALDVHHDQGSSIMSRFQVEKWLQKLCLSILQLLQPGKHFPRHKLHIPAFPCGFIHETTFCACIDSGKELTKSMGKFLWLL